MHNERLFVLEAFRARYPLRIWRVAFAVLFFILLMLKA